MKKTKKKISVEDIQLSEIKTELKRTKKRRKKRIVLLVIISSLLTVAAISVLTSTFIVSAMRLVGTSMQPSYFEGDIVLVLHTKKISHGDIAAFNYGNKILVKRVIGSEGDIVDIAKSGAVYVNGDKLNEPYVKEHEPMLYEGDFPLQVPAKNYFMLGDNRKTSQDSRMTEIGTITKERIIGKVIFRIWKSNK